MPLACYNISMPYCSRVKFIDNEEGLKSFQFVMAAGNIPIYASIWSKRASSPRAGEREGGR